MRHLLQSRILKLTLTLVVLSVGIAFSASSILDGANKDKASVTSSQPPDTCQVLQDTDNQCAKSGEHSDAATETEHCQQHCGHCLTWIPAKKNCLFHNIVMNRVTVASSDSPQDVTREPGFRPPNL